MTHGRKGRLSLKAIWKTINIALVLLASAALLFCGYMYFQVETFYPDEYNARADQLRAQTQDILDEIDRQRQIQLEQQDYLSSELSSLGADGADLDRQISDLRAQNEAKTQRLEQLRQEAADAENMEQVAMEMRAEYAAAIRQLEEKINAGETDVKICYWTFDDGPSYYTQQVLDTCRENGIYVTFFTSREANSSAANDDPEVERTLLRGMITGGHAIGNHTFSHQYSKIAGNLYTKGIESFREMVQKQDEWIFECTGIKPDIFRFPGGSAWAFSSTVGKEAMLGALEELGYRWIDWSCDAYDNGIANPSAATVYANAVSQIKTLNIAMILSHDWNVNTVQGFARAVPALKDMGYIFLPLFSDSWTIDNTTILFS